jgi:hypothetical protein
MALAGALKKHFNVKFSVYRKDANTAGSLAETYSLHSSGNDAYLSMSTKRELLENGTYLQKTIYRFRTLPLDVVNNDRVLVTELRGTTLTGNDREIYQVLTVEDFDRLADEQVAECEELNKGELGGL